MSEWIKTSERLPVESDNVLLYVNDGRDKYITFGYIFSYDDAMSGGSWDWNYEIIDDESEGEE